MDLSIIIVNYNTSELLKKCLDSLYKTVSDLALEIFVVDNGSTDKGLAEIEKKWTQVEYIKNKENLGFSKANNQALRRAKGRNILLLNSDTEVLNTTLTKMTKFLDSHSEMGVIGCKLLNLEGTLQYSYGKFPDIFSTILRLILSPQKRKYALYGYGKTHEVDWVTGAVFMIKKEVIEKVGFLDEDYFMYYEETDWCYRIKKTGWKIFYFPEGQVIHHFSYKRRTKKVLIEIRKSHLLFYKKNYSENSFQRLKKITILIIKLKILGLTLFPFFKKKGNIFFYQEMLREIFAL